MCGIFGFSGKQAADVTKIRWLAVQNESRGRHSTGFYVIKNDKHKTKQLFKDVGSAEIIVQRPEIKALLPGSVTVQGHTRAATVGSITKENAHPFEYNFTGQDNGTLVIGAHNGFVLSEFKGKKQHEIFGFDKEFVVDSMLIFAALAKTGDYNILPQIEGGIACSFQMPEKYGNTLFLYQASGRSLHIGVSHEGMYYSSEALPLKLVGCSAVREIPYNTMAVLENGKLLDFVPMKKPEIQIPINAKRETFHTTLSQADKEKLGLAKLSDNEDLKDFGTYKRKNVGTGSAASRNSDAGKYFETTNKAARESSDALGLLVKDVVRSVEALVDDPIQFSRTSSYTNEETDSCLLLISLKSSTKNQDLPGWVVYDEATPTIAGVTALNGVTVLKFPKSACGKKHKLLLTCPVDMDGPSLYSIEVDPEASRVQEVALSLPFPQTDKSKSSSRKTTLSDESNKAICRLGQSQLSLYTDGSLQSRGAVPNTGHTSSALQKQDEQIYLRLERKQVDEQQGRASEEAGSAGEDKSTHKRIYLGPSNSNGGTNDSPKLKRDLPPLGVTTMRSVIAEENKSFANKHEVRKILHSQEYARVFNIWKEIVEDRLDLRRIFGDAALLKIYDFKRWNDCYSLSTYVWRLAVFMTDDYTTRKLELEDVQKLFSDIGRTQRESLYATQSQEVGIEKKSYNIMITS